MTKTRYDIITFGSATRDVFLRSEQFRIVRGVSSARPADACFALGSKIEVDDIRFETGGGATNSAVCFARLGYRTAFVGQIGANDVRGREILGKLRAEGVSTDLVHRDRRHGTAYSVVLLTASGERTVLVYRGASRYLSKRAVPWRRLDARWFYITSLAGNLGLLRQIIAFAREHKIRVAFNPGLVELERGRRALGPILRGVDVLILNRSEAALLAGRGTGESEATFRDLCFSLPGVVVVTDGKRGATICDNERRYRMLPRHVPVVDVTGAGDAFGSGFVAAYLARSDLHYALQFATENAESVIQSVGAKAGLLRRFPARSRVRIRSVSFPN